MAASGGGGGALPAVLGERDGAGCKTECVRGGEWGGTLIGWEQA